MNIRFRGAVIRYYDTRKDDGGAYTRIYMTARADKDVRKKMTWDEAGEDGWPGEGVKQGKLSGTLSATTLILTPNDKELSKHEIEIGCNKVSDFSFSVEHDAEGNRKSLSIQFVVRSNHPDASVKVDRYFRNIQDALGELKVDYTKQEKLPLGDEEAVEEE
jgi:hypothetical protein